MSALPVSSRLPDFPWDLLVAHADRARLHPGGAVDLSVGTPIDPTPRVIQDALNAAADSPGYPTTAGRAATRQACVDWLARRFGVTGLHPEAVLPVIGSKELIASLPSHLGLGPDDLVVYPELAYPTYEVGAKLAGARTRATDSLTSLGPERVALVWVNSPSNPTGAVMPASSLCAMIDWARSSGAVIASDECYLPLPWESTPVSVLSLCGSSFDSVLAVHSLSKRSNLAGYRAGFVAGDPALVASLLETRKHAGMIVPAPVQAAMVAALDDESHVIEQRAVYGRRRAVLLTALTSAGFEISHSSAGLYLWATRGELCWSTVDWLAARGILVAPGSFYGPAGDSHVRVALTATDERVDAAAARLNV